MDKIKLMRVIIAITLVAVIWRALHSAIGFSITSDVVEKIEQVTPTNGLLLKTQDLIDQKALELNKAKVKLKRYDLTKIDWQGRISSLKRRESRFSQQLQAGLALYSETSETNVVVNQRIVDRDYIEIDLATKGEQLAAIQQELKAATETLGIIENSKLKLTKTISQSSARLIQLEARLKTAESQAENFALLEGLLSVGSGAPDLGPISELLQLLDEKLYGLELLYTGDDGAAPSGLDYVGTGHDNKFNIEAIQELLVR